MVNRNFIMNSVIIKKSFAQFANNLRIPGLLLIVLFISIKTYAQAKDTTSAVQEKQHNNLIKINLTSFILYSSGLQMSYERVLSPKRSLSIFGGVITFPVPSAIANSNIAFDENKKKSGFSIGAEYRFYLAKENKYAAPRGVYLAPFISYYHFNNVRSGHDSTNSDKLTLNATVDFFNIGGELGYQFVIKNRFIVDCVIFGPAISSYYFNLKLDGVTTGDQSEKVQAILEALKDKFPLLKDVTKGSGISSNGISTSWSAGFRYVIQIGYRF
jgi:hypothetical protein